MRLAQLIADADLAPREHSHPAMEKDIASIIDILQGPEQVGGVRNGGLVSDVRELRDAINGGVALTVSQKVALVVAAIGGLASIISSLLLR